MALSGLLWSFLSTDFLLGLKIRFSASSLPKTQPFATPGQLNGLHGLPNLTSADYGKPSYKGVLWATSDMFFRFYNRPGLTLSSSEQELLRRDLLSVARAGLNPVPDYQCLSSRPDALDDKLILLAYSGDEDDEPSPHGSQPVAFTSAVYLTVPDLPDGRAVLHTGLTVSSPSLQRTGIMAQLFAQLFANVIPLHPNGLWVTTLAAVLSSLVQSEKVFGKTYPRVPRGKKSLRKALPEHLTIARTISLRHREALLISPMATFDESTFVFRGSLDFTAAAPFRKDVDDVRFWHRDEEATDFFRGLMRKGKGDEVLLVGFVDADQFWKAMTERMERARL
ncbi:hypothetical protein FB45DRAFT_928806 [Roridomyces roridus]|uniref:N-acetyltransferase domain-containing protein n=1 Tax=Roridomyces roridus TaxID=1738132 RepID=A0AAD7BHY5_9AGAR|nr:hypothetical protein FB45DRAFT_928806 [Roridomyces roridus]